MANNEAAYDYLTSAAAELRTSDTDASSEAALTSYRYARAMLDQITRDEVRKARELGTTWEKIGAALGMSKQAAHERFRPGAFGAIK